jgi:hypothetical protein
MAYEKGLKTFEESMKSKKDKKKSIEKFVSDSKYNSEIRLLMRNAIIAKNFNVSIREIKELIKKSELKSEYVEPPPAKRVKTNE